MGTWKDKSQQKRSRQRGKRQEGFLYLILYSLSTWPWHYFSKKELKKKKTTKKKQPGENQKVKNSFAKHSYSSTNRPIDFNLNDVYLCMILYHIYGFIFKYNISEVWGCLLCFNLTNHSALTFHFMPGFVSFFANARMHTEKSENHHFQSNNYMKK